MERLYKEECQFCHTSKIISGFDSFDSEERQRYPGGHEIPIFIHVHNKSTAKEFLKSEGWRYYKGLVFCPSCFKTLDDGYVVLDKYKQFYSKKVICDVPDLSFIMKLKEAESLALVTYNNEAVHSTNALPVICKYLKGEWRADVIGYLKVHSGQQLNLGYPKEIEKRNSN